jgi:outer membrane protein
VKRLLFLLLAATGAFAEEALTLRRAAEEALAGNPAITSADAQGAAVRARLDEARSAWLPRVELSETMIRSDNPVFVFGSLLEQGRFDSRHFDPAFLNDPDPLGNFRLALEVRYTVFDRLRRMHSVQQARNAVEQTAFGTDETRQAVLAGTIARFYGVLLAEEKRNVAEDAVRTGEADAAAMRDRFEQGLLVESDLLAAEVQLASFRQNLVEADGDLAIARAALGTLLHRRSAGAEGSIPESLPAELELEAAIERALTDRGEVRSLRSATENARLQVAMARSSILPRVDAFASWGQSSSSLSGGDPDTTAGVAIRMDLFDPGRRARIASSSAGLALATAGEASLRDRLTMEVVTAWHRTHAARERIELATRSVERAGTAGRIVRDRYEHGLTTITEHLRAQSALLAARLELLAARHDAIVNHAELLRATGGLHEVSAFE